MLADAKSAMSLEQFNIEDKSNYAGHALQEARSASAAKRKSARNYRRELHKQQPIEALRR